MTPDPMLLPAPRHLAFSGDALALDDDKLIVLNTPAPQALRLTAAGLQHALSEFAKRRWGVVAGSAIPDARVGVRLNLTPGAAPHPQGYELTITRDKIDIVASTTVGLHYGSLTLIQLLQAYGADLPCLHIEDWPDFAQRGVMLDISRDKVPTMETLYGLVDMLASWKISQLQLYTEHTFAYQKHPDIWAEASPLTGEEILVLDAYCRERFIELVPNQNAFGHMHRWLQHERYLPLAEVIEGAQTPWGFYREGPYSLSPAVPGSLDLVRDMLDELLPHFSSRQINVGCDETFDLGQGRSKELVEQQGVGRVYLDFLLKIYREVKARGHTMQFWGDIIMEHPGLVPELPRDAIALEWGYEADHPFDEHGARFAASGIPFYVCPGTSSWRTLAGRTDNALDNLRNAADNGLKHGAVGYLNTDWGDNGHWQPLPVSYLGFLSGAALSWGGEENRNLDVIQLLDCFVFQDRAGVMGRLAFNLGNVYQIPGLPVSNGSIFFNALQDSPEQIRRYPERSPDPTAFAARLRQTRSQIDAIISTIDAADMQIEDAALVKREFTWVADMLRHACNRILWALSEDDVPTPADLAAEANRLITEFDAIWHARNRPGGFEDSVARMQNMRAAYG